MWTPQHTPVHHDFIWSSKHCEEIICLVGNLISSLQRYDFLDLCQISIKFHQSCSPRRRILCPCMLTHIFHHNFSLYMRMDVPRWTPQHTPVIVEMYFFVCLNYLLHLIVESMHPRIDRALQIEPQNLLDRTSACDEWTIVVP